MDGQGIVWKLHLANIMGSAQISEVKEKIAKEKGWEPSQQKLIYSGMFHTADTYLRGVALAGSEI